MSKPTYQYLPIRGRGELPRLVAAVGGVDFVDERVPFDDFPAAKEKAPFGQLGCLEVNGVKYAQKLAISIYFAKQCDLYEPSPSTALTQLQRDGFLLLLEDIMEKIVMAYVDRNFAKKPESLVNLKETYFAVKMPFLEKVLAEHGSGYYCGSKLTMVDLAAFDVVEHVVDIMGQGYLDGFPKVKANFAKVSAIPALKQYVDSRPAQPEGFEF